MTNRKTPLAAVYALMLVLFPAMVMPAEKGTARPPSADKIRQAVSVTKKQMEQLGSLIESYKVDNFGKCPAGDMLQALKVLKEQAYLTEPFSTADAWGSEIEYLCRDTSCLLASKGPDLRWGSEDDLMYSDRRFTDERPFSVPRTADELRSHLRLLSIGVKLYRLEHDGRCPPGNVYTAYRALEESGAITPPLSVSDPWGTDYLFRCDEGEGHSFTSAGPDRKFGTEDDIAS